MASLTSGGGELVCIVVSLKGLLNVWQLSGSTLPLSGLASYFSLVPCKYSNSKRASPVKLKGF